MFINDIDNNKLKRYVFCPKGERQSDYKDKLSVYAFNNYLYSLRHYHDCKNNGGAYRGE